MTCLFCNRTFAISLSICPSCGTMVNDSVREELALKISPIVKSAMPVRKEISDTPKPLSNSFMPKNSPTSEIMTKTTSPTLVDFQNKNATLPDWRLHLQNSVRKRLDSQNSIESAPIVLQSVPSLVNLGIAAATALKIENNEEELPISISNPTVDRALKRIEQSRRKYLISEVPPLSEKAIRSFPLDLTNKPHDFLFGQGENQNGSNFAKPNIVPFYNESKAEKLNTNKLPPLPPPAKISSSFEKRLQEIEEFDIENENISDINSLNNADVIAFSEREIAESESVEDFQNVEETEEIDDCAPISLRFNAALFDLLICSFLSLVLLAPFMLLNGRFFSLEGFFAFVATSSIVMFIYMTTTIGFIGRTFGMRIFSLEIVDVEENAYPTMHQAAVSSSVYLLSMALGGIGFLTMLLNSEKRAIHDLISGTIIVKEY